MYLHIAIGDSAAGNIKKTIELQINQDLYGEVCIFRDDLTSGPIFNLLHNIEKRIDWQYRLFQYSEYSAWYPFDVLQNDMNQMYQTVFTYVQYQKDLTIVIWYGSSVNDQLSLRFLVSQFSQFPIYEVPVNPYGNVNSLENDLFHLLPTVGDCTPEQLARRFAFIRPVNEIGKQKYIQEWSEVSQTKGILRASKEGQLINVNEDYYDDLILQYIPQEFIVAHQVIQKVLHSTSFSINHLFIGYRLRLLIEAKKIKMQGNFNEVYDYQVKNE